MKVKIPRYPVDSSNINTVGHDPNLNILEVEFKNGGVFQYHGVGADTHKQLLKAESVGSFFHTNIKNNYEVAQVEDAE